MAEFESREYKIFQQEEWEEKYRFSLYEKLARFAGSKIRIKTSPNAAMQSAIDYTGLKVSQSDVLALSLVTFLTAFTLSVGLAIADIFTTAFSFFLIALSFMAGLQVYFYPRLYTRVLKLRASSEIVLMILYITISMRQVPNLEHAVKFAALNLKGVLAYQLRKLIWDVETRRFEGIHDALKSYIDNIWSHDYPEVKESFNLIMASNTVSQYRREEILKESIDVILQGAKERAMHYSQELRTPVTLLNTMGILLPIIALVLLPIVTIFLTESISPVSIILIYNIMIPFLLVLSIYYVLQKRPWTFSLPDISRYPGIASKGMFSLAHIKIPSLIPALIVGVLVAAVPVFLMGGYDVYSPTRLFLSLLFTLALSSGIGVYMYLNSFQKTELRDKIIRMEQAFSEALFSLGSKMSDGAPIETAIKKTIASLGESPLTDFFKIVLRNIEEFGMTFEQAIFHPQNGAINYYPSPLMRSIFTIITQTSYKGSSAAAQTMIVISRYLKGMHDTEEEMRSILSETTSSLEFQAWALAPITTGIVVALAAAVQRILKQLEFTFGSLEQYFSSGDSLGENSLQPFITLDKILPPEMFQLIVGVYLIEVVILISYFYVTLTRGDEWISKQNYTGKMLIVSTLFYSLIIMGLYMVFNAIIPNLVGAV